MSFVLSRVRKEKARRLREWPLAWHLAALCVSLIVPILILAATLAWFYAQSEREQIEQEAIQSARDVIAVSDRELSGLIATTKVLATSRLLQNNDIDGFDALARDVRRQIGLDVVLRDRQSRQLVNTFVPRGDPLPTTTYFESDRAALATKKPVVSNLFVGALSRRLLFIVNVPVFRSGDVIYFLNLSLPPARMRDVILDAGLPAGWTAALADRDGFVIAHSSQHGTMLNRQLPASIRSKGKDREGVMIGKDVAGDQRPALIAVSHSQLSDWISVVFVPADEVAAPLRRALLGLLGGAFAILASSVGLAFVFARRIRGSVGSLAVEAAHLGKGETVHRLATPLREVNSLSVVLCEADQERRAAEERQRGLQFELVHASRLSTMGLMVAALAHELNQPLGAATNFMGVARIALKAARPGASARVMSTIDNAIEQIIRAGAIVARLRAYVARGEAEKSLANPRHLIEDAVALALVGVTDPKLKLDLDLAPDDRPLLVDRIQAQQVVFNLLRNALEATEGRASREIVVVTRSTSDTDLEISIADNGPGLPENCDAIFEPFSTTKTHGMGLGLSICRMIVEAHGGRLWAEPRPCGGTVFRFTLPLAPLEEAAHGS